MMKKWLEINELLGQCVCLEPSSFLLEWRRPWVLCKIKNNR